MQDFFHQLIPFVQQHFLLCLAFAVALFYVLHLENKDKAGGRGLSCEQAVDLMNHQQALVLDVRARADFDQGHIVRAVNIELDVLSDNLKKIQKYHQKPVVIVDAIGRQAAYKARLALKRLGFAKAQVLAGGMAAWRKGEMPIVRTIELTGAKK